MDPLGIGVIAVSIVIISALVIWQRRRTSHLHSQYGREYDRAVDELGRVRAQRELVNREQRVSRLNIRALTREQRDRFADSWQAVQAQFVDDPEGAVTQGDRLVEDVMDARGYPIADFDQRIADLSVHHAPVLNDYRTLREIAQRHRLRTASTEDLRQAMVHLRAVLEDMLENREHVGERVVDRTIERDDVREPVSRHAPPPLRPDSERRL